MQFRILLYLFYQLLVAQSDTNSTDLSSDPILLLSSEKTPTRAPRPIKVTKPNLTNIEKQIEEEEQQSEKDVSHETQFFSDCSEPLNKEISCLVKIVDCAESIFPDTPIGHEPPTAHDVRIAPTIKIFGATRIDKREHKLHVDVSWQIPNKNSSKFLRAFKLHVSDQNGNDKCFVFNVTHQTNDDTIAPRYRFSSSTLFNFSTMYNVTVFSLPKSASKSPRVFAVGTMPEDPDTLSKAKKDLEVYCNASSNKQASKWAASFRKIFLFEVIKMIQIEFLAAPPQYCFEEYEVRLLDSAGIVIAHSAIVKREDLKTEFINGNPVQFGEYNFTGIEYGVELIPSVIPVETSTDGKRCLCETENGCSCLAADWKPVQLKKLEVIPKSPNETMRVANDSEIVVETNYAEILTAVMFFMVAIIFFLVLCFGFKLYKKYEKRIKEGTQFQFIAAEQNNSSCGAPLIAQKCLSVLILYSHDCGLHEASVLAFAELLRNVFNLQVHLDVWDEEEIEENRAEYVNSSVVRADKILIINSIGSYHRVTSRHLKEQSLERISPGLLDNIFINQIDFALQHMRIISLRFSYTPSDYTLFSLSPLLQFSIPGNLNHFVSAVTDGAFQGERPGFVPEIAKLQTAVSNMTHFIEKNPNWFEESHHRVAPEPKAPPKIIPIYIPNSEISLEPEKLSKIPLLLPPDDDEISEESASIGYQSDERVNENIENQTSPIQEIEEERVKDLDDSGCLDSAYGGSDFSQEIQNIEILDKPRLIDSHINTKFHDEKRMMDDSAFHDDHFIDPRYRFSSSTLFNFSTMYNVTVFSLPKSASKSPRVFAVGTMPEDPDTLSKAKKDLEVYCNASSNKQASKWAASFRKIFLFEVIKMIQIEFLAAPPQYCFEEYEVRLLDSAGIVIAHSAIVKREDLKTEFINGNPVQFGEYNFTGIEYGVELIPSVIPVETSTDGKRCLCETENGCSCLAADWKPVQLKKLEVIPKSPNETMRVANDSEIVVETNYAEILTAVMFFMVAIIFFLVLCFGFKLYKKYEKRIKEGTQFQFIAAEQNNSSCGAPLIAQKCLSVLILYSHDCGLHEASVLAFAELLRNVFNLQVHLDVWDEEEIEENRAEYVNSSVVRADKILIINSIGSYHRVTSRHLKEQSLERISPGLLDNIFINQIDFALQHMRINSLRFSYTPSDYTLFSLSPLLQFSIPGNLNHFVSAVTDGAFQGERPGFVPEIAKLQTAVSNMTHFIEKNPNWFEESHHRVAPEPKAPPKIIPIYIPNSEISLEPEKLSKIPLLLPPDDDEISEESASIGYQSDERVNENIENQTSPIQEIEEERVKDLDDSGCLDSAYGGSDFSQEIQNIEILDKPRLIDSHINTKFHDEKRMMDDSAFHDDHFIDVI